MAKAEDEPIRLVSELPTARERFLSRIVDHVLQDGWRTPSDFLKHFPPASIIESLAGADALRAKILVAATGIMEKIALKKSIRSAAEDLELALDEGAMSAEDLVAQYPSDDRVRYLDEKKLWEFVVEDEFWKALPAHNKPEHSRAAARLTFMIECALSENLLTLKDVTDGMTFQEIATSLPVMELQEIVKHALQIARADAPLTEERLLAVVPLASLVEFVKLEHTWQNVIQNKVAAECGWAERIVESVKPRRSESEEPRWSSAPPPPTESSRPAPASSSERPPEEDDARRRVIERLEQIDRLPPKADQLSTPILLSMESMYADLADLTDDEDREACIHESFPNEAHLRQAMLALIDLLDPSVNTEDPVIRDAEVEGLIKLVLFEERRRSDPGRKSQASIVSNTGGSGRRRNRSMPPPLPRGSSSSSPPPLPEEAPARSKRAT